MATENNICESIEIALLSDIELSKEQKNHIKNCQNCRALLLQTEAMKKDLSSLSVPGLYDGQIAEKVMNKIRSEKARPALRYRFTHHLGTVAAAVIVLVAALIIKNPTQQIETSKNDTAALPQVSEHGAEPQAINHKFEFSGTSAEAEDAENEKVTENVEELGEIMRMATGAEGVQESDARYDNPASTYFGDGTSEAELKSNENLVLMYSITDEALSSNEMPITDDTAKQINSQEEKVASVENDSNEEISDNVKSNYGTLSSVLGFDNESTGAFGFMGGGGGGGGAAQSSPPVFKDIEFLEGEENFDLNIEKVNQVLSTLYPEYTLTRNILEKFGYDTNEKFIALAKTMTESKLQSLIAIASLYKN